MKDYMKTSFEEEYADDFHFDVHKNYKLKRNNSYHSRYYLNRKNTEDIEIGREHYYNNFFNNFYDYPLETYANEFSDDMDLSEISNHNRHEY